MMLNFCDEGELEVSYDTLHKDGDTLEYDVCGVHFSIAQEPGTTLGGEVWRSGQALAKMLCAGVGSDAPMFSASQLGGTSAIELGAGCAGLAGLALAALGCTRVVLTDQAEVLPLLRENVARFITAAQSAPAGALPPGCAALTGSIHVEELDWLKEEQVARMAASRGFDRVVCADGTYAESLHPALLAVTCAVAAPRAAVLFAEDLRSSTVHHGFQKCFSAPDMFDIRLVGKVSQAGSRSLCGETCVMLLKWQAGAAGDRDMQGAVQDLAEATDSLAEATERFEALLADKEALLAEMGSSKASLKEPPAVCVTHVGVAATITLGDLALVEITRLEVVPLADSIDGEISRLAREDKLDDSLLDLGYCVKGAVTTQLPAEPPSFVEGLLDE